MLVYALEPDGGVETSDASLDPQPPQRALRVVEELNSQHLKECEDYAARCGNLCSHPSRLVMLAIIEKKLLKTGSIRPDVWSWTSIAHGVSQTITRILSSAVGRLWKLGLVGISSNLQIEKPP